MPATSKLHAADLGTDVSRSNSPARILTLVHHHGSLSRAQLTRLTGLNRSTVSVLIAALTAQGLVYEAAPEGEAQVGRPSPQVHPNPAIAALAVNPEIDAVTIGLVGLGGRVLTKVRYPTERIPTAAEAVNIAAAVIAGMRGELDAKYRVVGVGVAVPGLVTAVDGVVRHAPHLDWRNEPVAAMLAAATGYRVRAANDASLAAEAEMMFGAGAGIANLVYLNGGASGIGGGIIADGRLLKGVSGYAGEIGHTLVRSDGTSCHCGAFGCLETEVRRAPLLEALALDAGEPAELVRALGGSADPAVTAEVHRQVAHLATALRNAVNIFNPEAVVLDGFLAALYAAAPEQLLAAVTAQSMREPGSEVTIHPAALGADLMMVGAAELAFAALLADPAGFPGEAGVS
ncbi:transcriptional regulator [Arthrobacter sp. ERGS1:01]|uniref:ROK family transcriptional regulator n=1 Tax=Arthrobacter sp. ERGS1:01 TaxID=1704044 RepID=UPI0006B47F68|nr:ROK family transcriptional regulator [Arthrobacter sp. ERGS1:01]ALE05705.1 transcriptional regulator [Arthrobacter sp. ERGS1:01]